MASLRDRLARFTTGQLTYAQLREWLATEWNPPKAPPREWPGAKEMAGRAERWPTDDPQFMAEPGPDDFARVTRIANADLLTNAQYHELCGVMGDRVAAVYGSTL